MVWTSCAMIVLPYARYELPGWGRLLRAAGVFNDSIWRDAPTRIIRGKWHGYSMSLDLSNWSERQTYFLGRFYDLPTQLFVLEALGRGEAFVDVGANIGMITLLAASRVGRTGQVFAFEPNPVACTRLKQLLRVNQLDSVVRVYEAGLGDTPGECTLSVITDHTGMGTLSSVPATQLHLVSHEYRVPVRRGDDVLPELQAAAVVKIDVEGFEVRVLQGLERLLRRQLPAVIAEVNPELLERAGTTVNELLAFMRTYSYEGFDLESVRRLGRHRLCLRRNPGDCRPKSSNMVWIHPQTAHWKRVSRFFVR